MLAPGDPGPIPAFLARAQPVWNYTMLMTYRDICERQAGERFVDKVIPYVETPEMAWGNRVHKAFQYRLERGQPLPEDMHQWEGFAAAFDGRMVICEQQLAVDRNWQLCEYYDKSGVIWGRSKADATVLSPDQTKAYLGDWKTGKPRENPFELQVQAVFLKARYPSLQEIHGQYHWLKEYRSGPIHNLSDFDATRNEIVRIYNMILNDWHAGHWPERPGHLCGWCDVLRCPHNTKVEAERLTPESRTTLNQARSRG